MKKLLFVIVCSLIVSASAFAQQGQGGQRGNFGTPEEQAQRQTDQFKTDLKLTTEQVPKVKAVNLTYAQESAKLRQNAQGGGDFSAMRDAMTKLETARGTALEKILNKEQMDAYKKWVADRPNRGGPGGGQRQGGGGQRNN